MGATEPEAIRETVGANPFDLAHRVFILWHLLSLDAPTVAVLWTIFLARLTHVPLPTATSIAMGLGVWILYAADRLFDTRHLSRPDGAGALHELEMRHLFHYRYRLRFAAALALATVLLAILVPEIPRAALDLYLIEAVLLALYFLVIHVTPTRPRRALPKEFLVGLFFAAATFIPAVTSGATLRVPLVLNGVLFTALCTLNCLYIYAWEHPHAGHPHGPTRAAIRLLIPATVASIALSLPVIFFAMQSHADALYPTACSLATVVLLLLHGSRGRISRVALRTGADAALLTPLLFLAFR